MLLVYSAILAHVVAATDPFLSCIENDTGTDDCEALPIAALHTSVLLQRSSAPIAALGQVLSLEGEEQSITYELRAHPCTPGSTAVTTAAQCQAGASAVGKNFGGSNRFCGCAPAGCFYSGCSKRIYWNTNPGSPRGWGICRKVAYTQPTDPCERCSVGVCDRHGNGDHPPCFVFDDGFYHCRLQDWDDCPEGVTCYTRGVSKYYNKGHSATCIAPPTTSSTTPEPPAATDVPVSKVEQICPGLLLTSEILCDDGKTVIEEGQCCPDSHGCPSACLGKAYTVDQYNDTISCKCELCSNSREYKMVLTDEDSLVKAHNYLRCLHGHPELAWDDAVAADAAQAVETSCEVGPATAGNFAKNKTLPEDAVTSWYNEIMDPGYTAGSSGATAAAVAHYTATIWKSSTKIGCSHCGWGEDKVWTCQYASEAPNSGEQAAWEQNVPQSLTLTNTPEDCCESVYGAGGAASQPTTPLPMAATPLPTAPGLLQRTAVRIAEAAPMCESWALLYAGACYGVIDQIGYDRVTPENQNGAVSLPPGYELVPYSDEIQRAVTSKHPFGTWRVVYANGDTYGTGKPEAGKQCGRCECGTCNTPDNLVPDPADPENKFSVSSPGGQWAKVFVVRHLPQADSEVLDAASKWFGDGCACYDQERNVADNVADVYCSCSYWWPRGGSNRCHDCCGSKPQGYDDSVSKEEAASICAAAEAAPMPEADSEAAPTPPTPANAIPEEMQRLLEAHNIKRCMHGVPLLTWDATIAANAQAWAAAGTYAHSSQGERTLAGIGYVGENLAWGYPTRTGVHSLEAWYDEVQYTDGTPSDCSDTKAGSSGEAICHYTQVVWKSSTTLGCGKGRATVSGKLGDFWVCQYGGGGNMGGSFGANVLAPTKSKEECASSGAAPGPAPTAPTPANDPACERCPAGVCDRKAGVCLAFNNGYHCKLGADESAPAPYSEWAWRGTRYFSLPNPSPCVEASAPTAPTPAHDPAPSPAGPEVTWVLLFRQTAPTVFQADEWSKNPFAPSNPNYAILDQLESYREGEKFEFKLVWPGSDQKPQQWRQTSNPVTKIGQGVEGYEAVDIQYTNNHWGGLEKSITTNTLLDGSVNSNSWWYAVGIRTLFQGGFPAATKKANAVELYVKQPEDPTCTDGAVDAEPVINFFNLDPAPCRSLRWACLDYAFVSSKCRKTCQKC